MNLVDKLLKWKNKKNSDKLELNQRPKDNRATLQSSALPAELLSESNNPNLNFPKYSLQTPTIPTPPISYIQHKKILSPKNPKDEHIKII